MAQLVCVNGVLKLSSNNCYIAFVLPTSGSVFAIYYKLFIYLPNETLVNKCNKKFERMAMAFSIYHRSRWNKPNIGFPIILCRSLLSNLFQSWLLLGRNVRYDAHIKRIPHNLPTGKQFIEASILVKHSKSSFMLL